MERTKTTMGGRWKEGVRELKKKRQGQDGGIEEREGRREAQNCTWPLTGSNSSVSSDSSELTVLF